MEEIALVKCQLLSVAILGRIVIQRLDDLLRGQCLDGLGCDGKRGCVPRFLVALERSANGLEEGGTRNESVFTGPDKNAHTCRRVCGHYLHGAFTMPRSGLRKKKATEGGGDDGGVSFSGSRAGAYAQSQIETRVIEACVVEEISCDRIRDRVCLRWTKTGVWRRQRGGDCRVAVSAKPQHDRISSRIRRCTPPLTRLQGQVLVKDPADERNSTGVVTALSTTVLYTRVCVSAMVSEAKISRDGPRSLDGGVNRVAGKDVSSQHFHDRGAGEFT